MGLGNPGEATEELAHLEAGHLAEPEVHQLRWEIAAAVTDLVNDKP